MLQRRRHACFLRGHQHVSYRVCKTRLWPRGSSAEPQFHLTNWLRSSRNSDAASLLTCWHRRHLITFQPPEQYIHIFSKQVFVWDCIYRRWRVKHTSTLATLYKSVIMGIPYSREINAAFEQVTPLVQAAYETLETTKNIALILLGLQIAVFITLLFSLLALVGLLFTLNPDLEKERKSFVTPVMKWMASWSMTSAGYRRSIAGVLVGLFTLIGLGFLAYVCKYFSERACRSWIGVECLRCACFVWGLVMLALTSHFLIELRLDWNIKLIVIFQTG